MPESQTGFADLAVHNDSLGDFTLLGLRFGRITCSEV